VNVETLNEMLDISPFHRWLGVRAMQIGEQSVEFAMPWREEIISNPYSQTMHGGVLASLIDLCGLYTILAHGGEVSATADLRVDYHRGATPGAVSIKSSLLKLGSRLSTAETFIYSQSEKLLASGRGAYLTSVSGSSTSFRRE